VSRPDTELPLVEELNPAPDSEAAFLRLATLPHTLFLDSARRDPHLGRYSFLAADPFAFLQSSTGEPNSNALEQLAAHIAPYSQSGRPDLPPFQGGAAGVFGYDLGRQFERLPSSPYDEFAFPQWAIGLYDVLLAIDHWAGRAWIVSQGWPETDPTRRRTRAQARLEQFRSWLCASLSTFSQPSNSPFNLAPADLAPQHIAGRIPHLTSNFTADAYEHTVARAIEYIRAGDIFQVNLAQRLLHPAVDHSVELYLRLRRRNPAPFAAYFDLGPFQIASASPERFVQILEGHVETRPIKGTRQRAWSPEADLYSADELQASEKDRAENVMIVDLLRNDLSRVCRPESVLVRDLCRLETYEFVQHLVSVVVGQLQDRVTPLDLIRATFPGGSITGAPKIRAQEIIAELEPTARGAYCGCLGYLGFDGATDLNILIRTITAGRGWWQAPVGGGIVAASLPRQEYEETWHKAAGLIRAMI
jgi:para-aminobenzoate synthetase component 1